MPKDEMVGGEVPSKSTHDSTLGAWQVRNCATVKTATHYQVRAAPFKPSIPYFPDSSWSLDLLFLSSVQLKIS